MTFLSASELVEIRNDPHSIKAIFDARRDKFVLALDMPMMHEEALIAAFCSVAAYELTPYGPEPQSNDLAELLASPTLACDRYVTVTWLLLQLFGLSTEKQSAVGWDGGAVGNHAQMLVSVGGTNLLLDPTIGLIVHGATYNGLIDHVKYSAFASFYSRSDIGSFNSAVVNAICDGGYDVRDKIYYVTSLEDWVSHWRDIAGVCIENGNDSQA